MKAILNIGIETTENSDLKSFLLINKSLLEKNGYYISKAINIEGHQGLLSFLSYWDKKKDDHLKQEFVSLPSHIHTVILTNENFHSIPLTKIEDIKQSLNDLFTKIEITCYISSQQSLCTSSYSTLLKKGSSISFIENFNKCSPSNNIYQYYNRLQRWNHLFNKSVFKVRLSTPRFLYKNNLVDDFAHALNPELYEQFNTSFNNRTLCHTGQLLLRILNIVTHSKELNRVAVINLYKEIILGFSNGKGQTLKPKMIREINKNFKFINEKE